MRSGQGSAVAQGQGPQAKRNKKVASAASRSSLAAKRGREESRDEQSEDKLEDNEPWEEHLQRLLQNVPNGAKEYENLRMKMTKAVDRLLQDKMESKMLEVVKQDKDNENCARSLMAFNVDKWEREDEDRTIEERITEDIHRMCRYRVSVLDVVAFKQQEGRPMAAKITLGSPRQKRTVYSAVAEHIQNRTKYGNSILSISLRDCFPREKTLEAKKLADKGMALKRQGKISAFRVVSQGPSCIPVLQTRTTRGPWAVHQLQNEEQDMRTVSTKDAEKDKRVTVQSAHGESFLAAAEKEMEELFVATSRPNSPKKSKGKK